MILREHVPLASLTTLRIGGNAQYVAACATDKDIETALAFKHERGLPLITLGEGSNVLASDAGYAGIVLQITANTISFTEAGNTVLLVADAGAHWDDLVTEACARDLWGIENLAGIPGTAGAAPVQNIGAYGRELSDTLSYVDVYDCREERFVRLEKEDCGLGYRESRFKKEPHMIVVRIALTLSKTADPRVDYKDLAARAARGAALDTPRRIAEVVRSVRAKKFPDLSLEGTAGSFFKNPILTAEAYASLQTQYPELPGYESGEGIKIPLAYVLDQILSLRGFRMGSVRLFEAQPLVLVADAGATAHEVELLAQEIVTRVFDTTGITIEREVRSIG